MSKDTDPQHSEASPQPTPGPFPALRRQITYRAGVYNDGGLEADLETAEALLAALKPFVHYSASLLTAIPDNKILEDMIAAAFEAIAKAEPRQP